LNNIQNIKKVTEHSLEAEQIQEEFYRLWEEGDIEKLVSFNRRLDIIAENHKAQSIQ
jgi:putative GTP pyrophosphokinase